MTKSQRFALTADLAFRMNQFRVPASMRSWGKELGEVEARYCPINFCGRGALATRDKIAPKKLVGGLFWISALIQFDGSYQGRAVCG